MLIRNIVRTLLPATFALLLAPSPGARAADDDRAQLPIEVQDWSVWVGTPAQTTINTARAYRNAMPGPVGTTRPKFDENDKTQVDQFPIAPLSVVQFFGEPTTDVDVELRVKSGNLLAHWPPGKDRAGRIQWFASDLVAAPPSGLPPAYLPAEHWFQTLRAADGALYLKNENTVERFLAYDADLTLPIPLKLRGGPDAYTLQNLTNRRLRDVVLIAPTAGGFRVGWLDELPTAVPEVDAKAVEAKKKAEEETARARTDADKVASVFEEAEKADKGDDPEPKEAAPAPLPAEGDATIQARMDQVLNRPIDVNVEEGPLRDVLDLIAGQARLRYELDEPTLAKEKIDPARPTSLQATGLAARDALAEVLANAGLSYRVTDSGTLFITSAARLAEALQGKSQAIEGPPVTLTLSQPLKADDPSYRELTRDGYARRLAEQGLRPEVVRTILDHYGAAIFEPGELIVVAHLSREAIDDAVPLDVFPPPKELDRVAILVIHGIDPRLQDQARTLVEQLGADSPGDRETAESKLMALGPVAVPALEDALRSKDIEIVFRAERLLLRLNRRIP